MIARETFLAVVVSAASCSSAKPDGELTLDIRNAATLRASALPNDGMRLTISVVRDKKQLNGGEFDVFDSSRALTFDMVRDEFREAGLTLYTATQRILARPTSRCGQTPITLAISLARRYENDRIAGSLAAYCGDSASGVPARIVRLAGTLPVLTKR